MKRLLRMTGVVASTLLLTGCGTDSKSDESKNRQNINQTDKGTATMARTKTPSGLEYELMQEGTGVSPQKGQQVKVHYTGWLSNNGVPGNKFDSSVDRGQPFTFVIGVGQVIKGWDEGVMGMKVGEKRRLIIPAKLGYGAQGAGGVIPPNATLIFEVELLGVK
jgi:FKBP-type peptidyl-prolyl cis-trans isomerase